jgi:type II secretory pathway component PulF
LRGSAREFSEFNGLLCAVVEKGLPLPPSIRLMAGIVRDGPLQKGLDSVARDVDEGVALPDAMARHPDAFPREYCGLVRAGVKSGRLPEVLRTAQIHHALLARLRSWMLRLLLYVFCGAVFGELVLLAALALAGRVLVFNKHLMIQAEMTEKDSFYELFEGTVESGWILLLLWPGLIGLAFLAYRILQRWSRLGWLGYAIPVWGRIQKSRDLALFCSALGQRLRTQAATVDALRSGRDAVVNRRFRRFADRLIGRVDEGESLSSAFFYTPFFPRTLAWAVSLGEENGEVPRTFDTFAALHTAEMEQNFELLIELLSPLGVLVVGNIALLSAILILAPFIQMVKVMQNL